MRWVLRIDPIVGGHRRARLFAGPDEAHVALVGHLTLTVDEAAALAEIIAAHGTATYGGPL